MAYRKDRDVTREIAPYRRILPFLTPGPTRNHIFFQQTLDLSKTLPWMQEYREKHGVKLTFLHLFVTAAGRMFHRYPRLNRYVAGHRYYQRDGVTISLSAKKEKRDGAKIVLLKVPIEPEDRPVDVRDRIVSMLTESRSGKDLQQEKEEAFFLKFPAFVLRWLLGLARWLHVYHLLPGFFVDPDPTFTSMVVANLGSVGLNSAYHHLYEWGNSPFFAAIGRIHKAPVVVEDPETGEDRIEIHPIVDIRYTFDERVEDGLATALALANLKELIEDPERFEKGEMTDFNGLPPERV